MAPNGKDRDKKKKKNTRHASVTSVPKVIAGTSTLSLPALGSQFPVHYAADTPSQSLDLCRLMIETGPNSNVFAGFHIHLPITDLMYNILIMHGLSENSQAVQDFRARMRGNPPSATMSQSEDIVIGMDNMSLEEKLKIWDSYYRNCLSAVEHYQKKSEEAGKKVVTLNEEVREEKIDKTTGTLRLVPLPKPEEVRSDESSTSDESLLGAVGGVSNEETTEDRHQKQPLPDNAPTISDETTQQPRTDDVSAACTHAPETTNVNLPTADSEKERKKTKKRNTIDIPRKKNFKKVQNFWEAISTDSVRVNLSSDSSDNLNEDSDHEQDEPDEQPPAEESITQVQDVQNTEAFPIQSLAIPSNQPVPFNPSPMDLPFLQPNFVIPSDIGPLSFFLNPGSSTVAQPTTSSSDTNTETTSMISTQPSTDPSQDDSISQAISESKDKFQDDADEQDDGPIIISPAALGGTEHQPRMRTSQRPIGHPRTYEIRDGYVNFNKL